MTKKSDRPSESESTPAEVSLEHAPEGGAVSPDASLPMCRRVLEAAVQLAGAERCHCELCTAARAAGFTGERTHFSVSFADCPPTEDCFCEACEALRALLRQAASEPAIERARREEEQKAIEKVIDEGLALVSPGRPACASDATFTHVVREFAKRALGLRGWSVKPKNTQELALALFDTLPRFAPPSCVDVTDLSEEERRARRNVRLWRTRGHSRFWYGTPIPNRLAPVGRAVWLALKKAVVRFGTPTQLGTDDLDSFEVDHRKAERLARGGWRRQLERATAKPPDAQEDAEPTTQGAVDELSDAPGWDDGRLAQEGACVRLDGVRLLDRALAIAKNDQERLYAKLLSQGDRASAYQIAGLTSSRALAFERRIARNVNR